MKDYAANLFDLVNKIRFGEEFPDSRVVEKMMISLPARFESNISTIEESYDLKTLSIVELISKLQAQEQMVNYSRKRSNRRSISSQTLRQTIYKR